MKFTNTQPGPRGVNTINGPVLIDPNQTVDGLQVYERERAHIEASGWFKVEGEYTPERNGQSGAAAPAPTDQLGEVARLTKLVEDKDAEIATLKAAGSPVEAKHRGGGSYSVQFGDFELREKLTKDQAEAFNALDTAGRAKWLVDNKPAA